MATNHTAKTPRVTVGASTMGVGSTPSSITIPPPSTTGVSAPYISTSGAGASAQAYSRLQLTLHPDPYTVCEAVMLLTKRMESNIQEFYLQGEQTKFGDITYAVRSRIQDPEKNKDKLFILSDTEIQYYWNAYIKESKRALHEEVMARILKANDEDDSDE